MTAETPHLGTLARLADAAYRRPWRMILAWVVLLAAIAALAARVAGELLGDSQRTNAEGAA